MRRLQQIILLLLVISLPLAAQVPDWYEAASRRMRYPSDSWYSGFAIGEQHLGETLDDAIARLKNEARAELASTIRTSVEQNITNRTQSDMQQSAASFDERITETFVSDIRISSSISDISGLNIDSYVNKGRIAAFAYIKRTTLINQLIRRITVELAKTEGLMPLIEQQMNLGNKVEARKIAGQGIQQITKVEDAQSLLSIVDTNADEDVLQTKQTQELRQHFAGLIAYLKNSIAVYLDCNADLFGASYSSLRGEIHGALCPLGCSFVSSAEQSDWVISVTAVAREYNAAKFGNITSYTAFVDADITVDKMPAGQRIYANRISGKGIHTHNYEQAAREAYRQLSPELCNILKEQIQQ